MISAEWHPDDERLLTQYLERGADATLEAHLARCQTCARRASHLADDLEQWHGVAAEQADVVFDGDRLAAQRRGVQQRLGAVVPARILAFPAAVPAERHPPLSRIAAAVLLVAMAGAGVFRMLHMPHTTSAARARVMAQAPSRVPVRLVRDATADASVLEDIDIALVRPRTAVAELRALDEFTPHVRDLAPGRR